MCLATHLFFAFLCLFGHSCTSLFGSLLAFRSLKITTKVIVEIIKVNTCKKQSFNLAWNLNLNEQTLEASRLLRNYFLAIVKD